MHRLWTHEGLLVPKRQREKRRLGTSAGSCVRRRAEFVHHVWSSDFVWDQTEDVRHLKIILPDLRNLYVYSSHGNQKVPLRQIASLDIEMRREQIKRRYQFRTITVQAYPRGSALPSKVLAHSKKSIDRFDADLPPGVRRSRRTASAS